MTESQPAQDPANGLAALETRLRREMELLQLPAASWLPQPAPGDAEVVVVGAGMLGLCAAAALKMLGVDRVRLLDRAPAGQEGPWVTYARMRDLRTRKELAGPALGLPSLTFRAWYEAQHGAEGFAAMVRIPRGVWMDYLGWYREVLGLEVENDCNVVDILPEDCGCLLVTCRNGRELRARHVVLATGPDGHGAPSVPAVVRDLPRRFWAHSAEEIDFEALRGRRVGVIGVGASALDNAATALETGAARVDVFVRRDQIPPREQFSGIASAGLVTAFRSLPDLWKWRFMTQGEIGRVPPPLHTVERVRRHPNAFLHLASGVTDVTVSGEALRVETPRGSYEVDYLIAGTGFGVNGAERPELARFAGNILTWSDKLPAAAAQADSDLGRAPYLGPAFELLPRDPGTGAALSRIHAFNASAVLSQGKVTTGVPSVSLAARRLADGIATALFLAERERLFDAMLAFDRDEIPPGTWADADAEALPEQIPLQTES